MKISVRFAAILLLTFGLNVFAVSSETESSAKAYKVAQSLESNDFISAPTDRRTSGLNPSIMNDKNTFCMINAFSFHLYYVQITTYSTQGFGDCSPNDYFKLSPVSVASQLGTSGLKITRVFLSGVYHPTMDLSRVNIDKKYENFGLLKFFQSGISKFTLIDILKNPQMVKRYLKGGDYLPYQTSEDVYFIWNAGTEVYELIDPDGNIYVMTAYTDMFLQSVKIKSLADLGSVMDLPEGWSYRARRLDKLLAIESVAKLGNSTVRLADSYNNIYLRYPN